MMKPFLPQNRLLAENPAIVLVSATRTGLFADRRQQPPRNSSGL